MSDTAGSPHTPNPTTEVPFIRVFGGLGVDGPLPGDIPMWHSCL